MTNPVLTSHLKFVPAWVSEEMLSTSERIGGERAGLWVSGN